MDGVELVQKAMQKTGLDSTRKLGEAIGVSHVAVAHWLNGVNCPTFEQAGELALLAGLPPVSTAAEVRQHSKDGAKHKALLRRLAAIAATIAITTLATSVKAESAVVSTGYHAAGDVALYIMRN